MRIFRGLVSIGVTTLVVLGTTLMSPGAVADDLLAPQDLKSLSGLSLETLSGSEREEILEIGQLSIDRQIDEIKKKVPVELLKSNRKGGGHSFDTLGPAVRKVEDVTEVEGLYGKAVCPKNGDEMKILIADDAPPSTLLHEYIHFLQMKHDKRWCELDGRLLENDERKERALLYHRLEFETLKTLWDIRPKLSLTFEDKLILVEGLSRENGTLKSMGIKGLDSELAAKLQDQLDEIHAQINYLTWLTQTREDAGTVMQKMEVISLKSCVEQDEARSTKTHSSSRGVPYGLVKRINACIEKRCAVSGLKCAKLEGRDVGEKDDLLSKLIHAWFKPDISAECGVTKLKNELTDDVEKSTPCWKKWYSKHIKSDKDLSLKKVNDKAAAKRFGVASLPIDKEISYYEVMNPEGFISNTYCYFIFQKVARFDSLPVDQFAYAAQGASLSETKMESYRSWLETASEGQICSKLVKTFTGSEPAKLAKAFSGKKYILISNPIASLTGGVSGISETTRINVNHERLHILFADDKSVRDKIKKEWMGLAAEEQINFKKKHASYDFDDEDTLLREYFSYTRQEHPTKLF